MEILGDQNEFAQQLASEFGSRDWSDGVYWKTRKCNQVKNGGSRKCSVTGIRCQKVNGCKSAVLTRNLEWLHGDSTMGE